MKNLVIVVGLLTALSGCTTSTVVETNMPNDGSRKTNPNRTILREVNAGTKWFHAKKTAPLWAKRLERDQEIQTLEGPTTAEAGAFLCRGAAGEFWPQSAEQLNEKYDPTTDVDEDGFRKYLPTFQVMVAQVDHPFQVTTSWGVLEGKPGDFILKDYADRDLAYPENVWIVEASIFTETYERIAD